MTRPDFVGAHRRARLVPFDQLSTQDIEAWHGLRAVNPELDSPYFHPGFAAAVHGTAAPVSVVVSRNPDGSVRSLLPCHRERSLIRPAGWPGADFQGPLYAPGHAPDPLDLLVDGVRGFDFDHLLTGGPGFDPWIDLRQASPFLDTSGGLDGYLGRASRSGKDNMSQARRRAAKAERDIGPVKFEADTVDPDALTRVIELKRAQYAATGSGDFFVEPGRRELVHRLLHTRDPGFAGILSTLRIGPHLVAAHFGIRSGGVLHWWFPVYDPDFGQLAPGWILLRELVSATPSLGINRIDLGRGDDEYKRRAKTGETVVARGMVTRSSTQRALRRARTSLIATVKSSPLGPGLRQVRNRLRRGPSGGPNDNGERTS